MASPFTLHPDLQKQLTILRKKKNFDAKEWVDKKVKILNDYYTKHNLSGCVINLSGGVDSSCTAALCKKASLQPNSPIKRIIGISQPIHSTQAHTNRAKETAEAIGVEFAVCDQSKVHDDLKQILDGALGLKGGTFAQGQLKSYMRTPVAYYVTQILNEAGVRSTVVGTGNKDEDGYLGYFCKAGDGVVDIQLIGDLHKSEVFKVSAEVGVPKSVLEAPPSADLWDGQTDEEELGFSYDFVELWTCYLKFEEDEKINFRRSLSPEALQQFEDTGLKAAKIHRANRHKFQLACNL
uniref:NAD/GMP synthase domain-containing protein n=1 Tax=Paramoeba aestuarina TaxID=180227 RepID=A0A7S4KII8_9EUKA|eukprot:CAMPEP_0201517762 /NCGR_PEP_ID=MMETSP0161_2-20130828/8798_1 /ASSEMBLY_ACC=CAM_ASM_000251 /TAXON_ID=180227 /ORGANISM="Neoparamoeba aestuarina, Strain SoJaBio B1-5/56/2" /LENGTH=293 /DNA_ID=CAMNT_0047915373 /DNA_START=72 /DNA_END=953 /DNA_ORIENTATION=+